jgi:hypothetical protein
VGPFSFDLLLLPFFLSWPILLYFYLFILNSLFILIFSYLLFLLLICTTHAHTSFFSFFLSYLFFFFSVVELKQRQWREGNRKREITFDLFLPLVLLLNPNQKRDNNWEIEVQKIRRKKKAVGRELKRGWTFLYTDMDGWDGWDGLDQSSSNGWDDSLGSKFRWVLRCQGSKKEEEKRDERKGGCISLGKLERLDVFEWNLIHGWEWGIWALSCYDKACRGVGSNH